MEPPGDDSGAPPSVGGLTVRADKHVFKAPEPRTSLLGARACELLPAEALPSLFGGEKRGREGGEPPPPPAVRCPLVRAALFAARLRSAALI